MLRGPHKSRTVEPGGIGMVLRNQTYPNAIGLVATLGAAAALWLFIGLIVALVFDLF